MSLDRVRKSPTNPSSSRIWLKRECLKVKNLTHKHAHTLSNSLSTSAVMSATVSRKLLASSRISSQEITKQNEYYDQCRVVLTSCLVSYLIPYFTRNGIESIVSLYHNK